ncbi:MAG: DMT family transporter [Chloroflexi bacterium]|nr:DMT family transporter [Chloroflexota bacterium]
MQPNPTPRDNKRQTLLAYLALALGMLALGVSPLLVRSAGAPGPVTAFYRLSIAVVLLAPFFGRSAAFRGGLPKAGMRLALLAGLFFALDMTAWTTGVVLSGATNPTLLANTAPLWVGLGTVLIFRQRLGLGFWGGLALALAGAAVILGLDVRQASQAGLGSLFGLLAGVFYGSYFLVAQRGRQHLGALSFWWLSAAASSVALFAITALLRQPLTGYPPRTWWLFLAMGLIPQVVGYLSITYAQGHLPAALVSPTLLGQPVVTALLAWPILGEAVTGPEALGGLMVLAGVFVVHRSNSNGKPVTANS